MDTSGHRQLLEGFSQNSIIFINKGRMTTPRCVYVNLVENSLHSSFSLLVKSFEEEIQLFRHCVDIATGLTLEQLQEPFQ